MAPDLHRACAQEELSLQLVYLKYHKNKCRCGSTQVIPPVSSCTVLNVMSGTPRMGFCTSVTFFPQEHGVTCRPEQLHLCSPFVFQGLKT